MAAYAEGMGVLRAAMSASKNMRSTPRRRHCATPSTTSTTSICLTCGGWRRGRRDRSWLLDLTAIALIGDPALAKFAGSGFGLGEGRWTIKAANRRGCAGSRLTTCAVRRFSSRGEAKFADNCSPLCATSPATFGKSAK